MSKITQIINICLFFCLLVLLSISTIVYYYQEIPSFAYWLSNTLPKLNHMVQQTIEYAKQFHIQPRWGIALALFITIAYFIFSVIRKTTKCSPPNPATMFFINLFIVLLAGIVLTIYYWPEDTIRLGQFFQLNRGPRDKFLDKLFQIGLFVLVVHLFLFLCVNLYNSIIWKKAPIVKIRQTQRIKMQKKS